MLTTGKRPEVPWRVFGDMTAKGEQDRAAAAAPCREALKQTALFGFGGVSSVGAAEGWPCLCRGCLQESCWPEMGHESLSRLEAFLPIQKHVAEPVPNQFLSTVVISFYSHVLSSPRQPDGSRWLLLLLPLPRLNFQPMFGAAVTSRTCPSVSFACVSVLALSPWHRAGT